jgi:hypothetical protein
MSRRSELVRLARALGWSVAEITGGGHLKLVRPGCRPVIVANSPGDRRARLNMRAQLRRAEKASAHGAAARPAAAATLCGTDPHPVSRMSP